MRTAQTSSLLGLLQTVDHARVVFQQVVPALPPPEIEHRISMRIKRQAVLYRQDPVPYTAIIHEAARRMQFGGAAITKAQLKHLLEMGQRDNVTIAVIPFTAGAYPGSGQTVLYAHGPVPQLDTVQLDQSHGPTLLDTEAQLAKYRTVLDRLHALALGPEASQNFIHAIARDL